METYINELWKYLLISAPYFVIGLVASAFIHYFLNKDTIKKYLGGASFKNVFKAAAVGVPLPLCSCSVVPAAVTLKKNGASTAATSSFLISTPETGVDSIAITYALIGPPMAIIRPIAAFMTAFTSGIFQVVFKTDLESPEIVEEKKSCCSKNKKVTTKSFKASFKYAFIDLMEDMVGWLTIGLLLGALLNMVVPDDFFSQLGTGTSMLLMLAIGVPFYICASASTPIAAALLMKGMSPGSALLFLLVGPATNVSNIMIMQKFLGKKAVAINVITIIIVSVLFAFVVDAFIPSMDVLMKHHHHDHAQLWQKVTAIFFTALLSYTLVKKFIWKKFIK